MWSMRRFSEGVLKSNSVSGRMMMKAMQVQVAVGVMVLAAAVKGEPVRSDGMRKANPGLLRSVTGPTEPMNRAVAAGPTAIMILQPVQVPTMSYPPGSSIVGTTLTLGWTPARVWIEGHMTGWAPHTLGSFNHSVDALDLDGDGGGYDGDTAECDGQPMTNAGDLAPARQACTTDADCLMPMSGLLAPCPQGATSRCRTFDGIVPGYFPAGQWCEPLFINRCSPRHICQGIACTLGFDYSTLKFRFGGLVLAGGVPTDFQPSHTGTFVLDVPADAKGNYTIDLLDTECFLQNTNPPGANDIPIAELRAAVIKVPVCSVDADCDDGSACTVDTCVGGCDCANTPIAGWDPQTECCNPMNGAQGLIPASSPCRMGGCSLGGSSGTPTVTNIPDGTACTSIDPCYGDGVCAAGVCVSTQYAGTSCPKVRFISFEAGEDSEPKAWRVRMVSLHHPNPPYTGAPTSNFSAHEGQVRWVGPPDTFTESSSNPTPVHAAVVQCEPHYQDWTGYDLLHVTGGEIVPSSQYEVQWIAEGLDPDDEDNYSEPIVIRTARWGDLVIPNAPPSTTIQPDAGDISAMLDKFRSTSTSSSKPRALMVGSMMGPVPKPAGDVTFSDISAVVDANRGLGYPYAWPMPCP